MNPSIRFFGGGASAAGGRGDDDVCGREDESAGRRVAEFDDDDEDDVDVLRRGEGSNGLDAITSFCCWLRDRLSKVCVVMGGRRNTRVLC